MIRNCNYCNRKDFKDKICPSCGRVATQHIQIVDVKNAPEINVKKVTVKSNATKSLGGKKNV